MKPFKSALFTTVILFFLFTADDGIALVGQVVL